MLSVPCPRRLLLVTPTRWGPGNAPTPLDFRKNSHKSRQVVPTPTPCSQSEFYNRRADWPTERAIQSHPFVFTACSRSSKMLPLI